MRDFQRKRLAEYEYSIDQALVSARLREIADKIDSKEAFVMGLTAGVEYMNEEYKEDYITVRMTEKGLVDE